MTMVFDAGALLALERNDRPMWRRLKAAQLAAAPPLTHGGVIAQVWRGGSVDRPCWREHCAPSKWYPSTMASGAQPACY